LRQLGLRSGRLQPLGGALAINRPGESLGPTAEE
jgi:hypothetical protein